MFNEFDKKHGQDWFTQVFFSCSTKNRIPPLSNEWLLKTILHAATMKSKHWNLLQAAAVKVAALQMKIFLHAQCAEKIAWIIWFLFFVHEHLKIAKQNSLVGMQEQIEIFRFFLWDSCPRHFHACKLCSI